VNVFDTGDLDDEDDDRAFPSGRPIGAEHAGQPDPRNWANWRDDFFIPSSRLLVAAPWILIAATTNCAAAPVRLVLPARRASPLLGRAVGRTLPFRRLPRLATRRMAQLSMPFADQRFPTEPKPPMCLRLGGLNSCLPTPPMPAMPCSTLSTTTCAIPLVATMLARTRRPPGSSPPADLGVVKKDKAFLPETRLRLHQHHPAGPRSRPCFQRPATPRHRRELPPHARFQHRLRQSHPPQLAVGHRGMELSNVSRAVAGRSQAADRVPDLAARWVTWSASSDFGAMVMTSASVAPGRALVAPRVSTWRPAIRPGPVRAADDRCVSSSDAHC